MYRKIYSHANSIRVLMYYDSSFDVLPKHYDPTRRLGGLNAYRVCVFTWAGVNGRYV